MPETPRELLDRAFSTILRDKLKPIRKTLKEHGELVAEPMRVTERTDAGGRGTVFGEAWLQGGYQSRKATPCCIATGWCGRSRGSGRRMSNRETMPLAEILRKVIPEEVLGALQRHAGLPISHVGNVMREELESPPSRYLVGTPTFFRRLRKTLPGGAPVLGKTVAKGAS